MYLQRCIDSIKRQNNQNWELVLIDDGSKDETANICARNAEMDSRIHYYCQENQGVSAARNYGIKKAEGRIVSFVDADDMVCNDMVEKIILNWNDEMDILIFDYYHIEAGKKKKKKFIWKEGECSADILILNTCFALENPASQNHDNAAPWGKAYKKSFLIRNNLFFDKNIFWCEDRVFNLRCFNKASHVYHISIPVYKYCVNKNSVSQEIKSGNREYVRKIMSNFEAYRKEMIFILEVRKGNDSLYSKAIFNEYVYILKLILWTSETLDRTERKELLQYCDKLAEGATGEHVQNAQIENKILVWLCHKHFYKLILMIVRLRKC